MFQRAKNIDTAFRQVRLFTLWVVAGSIGLCCFIAYQSFRATAALQSRIYILAGGRAMEAFAGDRKENIPVEAKDHVTTFHESFFSLDPDDKVITAHLTRALYLADASAKRVYESLKETGYYAGLVAGNISQELQVDSVQIDARVYPFYFRLWGQERIIRPSTVTTRSLITEGYLRNVARSDNNPHGFLMENWRILENKDQKTEAR